MSLPDPIIDVVAPFRPLFTQPTWSKLMTLLEGTILAHGRRTVAEALRQTGNEECQQWSTFHQVLNRACWSELSASRVLLSTLVETAQRVGIDLSIEIAVDETLERRWGKQIKQRGRWRDPLISGRDRAISCSGLRWIVLSLVVSVPWSRQRCALPFLTVLTTTPKVSEQLDKRHKTLGDWMRQVVLLLRRWMPDVPIKLIGDGAYSCIPLGLTCHKHEVTLIAPLRLDAMLFEPPPPHPGGRGRRRVVGARLPKLEQVLVSPETPWQELTLDWYGQGKRTVQVVTGTALWYRTGLTPLPVRWVLTRDPEGRHPAKAFFSTDQQQCAEQIITDFMKRWPLEVTFEECRAHLGLETQRQWSDRAIARSTPLLLGLYSLVILFGLALHPEGQLAVRQAAWYRKSTATFSDVLATVRAQIWSQILFQKSAPDPDLVLLPRCTLDRVLAAVCY